MQCPATPGSDRRSGVRGFGGFLVVPLDPGRDRVKTPIRCGLKMSSKKDQM